jgi:hypothetical protein
MNSLPGGNLFRVIPSAQRFPDLYGEPVIPVCTSQRTPSIDCLKNLAVARRAAPFLQGNAEDRRERFPAAV